MAFECSVERYGDTITVAPQGDLGLETVAVMRELLKQVIETTPDGRIDIDMQAVTFLDSSGLGMLVAAQRAAAAKGTTLKLEQPGPMIRMVLEVSGLDQTLLASPVAD
jgi:anti-anti-sigma factor